MSAVRMRAAAFEEYGGNEVLQTLELPLPAPAPDQVRVRVRATTVNPADVQFRRGDHDAFVPGAPRPFCGGLEFVGTVDAVGVDVGELLAPGVEVAGTCHFIPGGRGSHAEYVVTDARSVVPVPAGSDPVSLATVPMNGLTAQVVVESLRLSPGATVALPGAAGAVGGYVTELAAAAGLRVIAISAPGDEEFLRSCGADAFVPRDADVLAEVRRIAPDGADACVDAANQGAAALPLVADGGVFLGLRPGILPEPTRGIEPKLVSFRRHQQHPDVLAALLAKAGRGELTPRVHAVFDLDQAREAFELTDTSGVRGRIVLRMPADPRS